MVVILSLPWAKSLSSFGIGIAGGISLVYALANRKKLTASDWLVILPFLALFLLGLWSTTYSDNEKVANAKLFLKLPMLLLPFALPLVREMGEKRKNLLLMSFMFMVFVVGLGSTIHYFMHFEELNKLVLQAKPIPILGRIYHIQFSVFNALSIFIGIHFYMKYKGKKISYLFLSLALANFIMLHILAARTGLFSFYISAFLLLVYYSIKYKSIQGFASISLLFLSLIGAYLFSTSFRNRCADTKKDLTTYMQGSYPNHFSNTQRLMALETGWNLFKANWAKGVGIGDVKTEMLVQYDIENSKLLPETRKKPHNQFLESMLQSGVLAALFLLWIFVVPFCSSNKLLLGAFILLMFFSMQFESLLERQSSLYVFLFFYVLLLAKGKEEVAQCEA